MVIAKRTIEEEPVVIDCPACHAAGVSAVPRYIVEPVLLLELIPLFTQRNTFIECPACHRDLRVRVDGLDELYALPRDALSHRLSPYTSFIGRAVVVAALVLFWFPFLAPILALAGLIAVRRNRFWRRLAIIAVVLSFLVLAAFAVVMVLH